MPKNLNTNVMHVNHADLRSVGGSSYRVCCPKCEIGILLIRRDPKSFKLLALDVCVSCGQHVYFDDIDDLRKNLG